MRETLDENFVAKNEIEKCFMEHLISVKAAIKNGQLSIKSPDDQPLTDFDLAVEYAVSKEVEEKGCQTFTIDNIARLIIKHCGLGIWNYFNENTNQEGA